MEQISIPAGEKILVVTIVTVAISIVLHGLSAAPAARRYGALAARLSECEESKAVSEMPTRARTALRPRGAGAAGD